MSATNTIKNTLLKSGKTVATDQFSETLIELMIKRLGLEPDHPIIALLEHPAYRETAKAALSVALIYGVPHLNIPKANAIASVAELQLSASTIKILTEIVVPLREDLLNLGNMAETVLELESETAASFTEDAWQALGNVEKSQQ
jgi:hypothetical protein